MITITVPAIVISIVLVAVRALLVIVFAVSARRKLRDVGSFAQKNNLPIGAAWGVVLAEAAAALGMATGVLAQWAGLGIMLLMLGTMYLHIVKWKSPYWASKGGWEYDVFLFILAAVVVVFGAGQFVLFGV